MDFPFRIFFTNNRIIFFRSLNIHFPRLPLGQFVTLVLSLLQLRNLVYYMPYIILLPSIVSIIFFPIPFGYLTM